RAPGACAASARACAPSGARHQDRRRSVRDSYRRSRFDTKHTRLSSVDRLEHDPWWPVRQPHQHEAAARKGLTYGARTTFDFRRGRGPFILQTSVQSDSTAVAVQEAIGEILAIRTDRPPTEHEVEIAKAALTRGYARNFETAEQVARAMSQLMLYGLPD